MARKTREEALATRGAILDAAETVFQERAVGRTSLAEIAAVAGVTRGAVYWHFANKVELFDAIIERVAVSMDAKLDELRTERHYDDPVEMLRELALYFLDRVEKNPSYRRVVEISWLKCEYVGEMVAIRDKHFKRSRDFRGLGAAAFRESRDRGFLSPGLDPHAAAIGLMAIVDGLVVNWVLEQTIFSLTETGARTIDAYLAGLRAQGKGKQRKR